MLACIIGSDSETKKTLLKKECISLQKINKNIQIIRLTPQDISGGVLDSYIYHGTGLFSEKTIVILPYLFEECAEKFSEKILIDMHGSSNTFFIIDHDLPKDVKVFLAKQKITIHLKDSPKVKVQDNSPFVITNAFISRDKKQAWTTLMSLKEAGVSTESIVGIIFWQVKTLLLVKESISSYLAPLEIKPFVLTQAKKGIQKYTKHELDHLVYLFATLLIRARRNNQDPFNVLEKTILSVL